MKQSPPLLTFIILNYNSRFWLKKTLTTLKEHYLNQSKTKVKTIVVDNHSTDESVKMIKKEFEWVNLIESNKNLGFAAGNNLALKNISSKYVMLLNNDVEFTPQTKIELLIEFMEKNPQVAVATPKILLADGQLDQACHRGEPTMWAALNQVHTIDACSGAAMLIRTKAMQQVGYLDERFFMYAEDLDWCRRFRQAGYKIGFIPQVEIIHHKYKSGIKTESTLTSLKAKRYFYNTMLQYYDKHYRQQYPRFFRFLLRSFIFIKKGGL